MEVIKRDGTKEQFNKEKIYAAIIGAMNDIGVVGKESVAHRIANDIEKSFNNSPIAIEIETIQDDVIKKLMASSCKDVAQQYVIYRYNRERIRQDKSELMQKVKEKLFATNVENQNANLDERSFSGRMNEANRVVMKDYALYNCMSEMSRNNHLNNYIYIHDLDSYAAGMHNCLSIPFDDLLANGFSTRQCDVRPASSVGTACQLIAVIFQLQSLQQFGGVSATHLDWTLVPYVRKSFHKHYIDGIKYIEQPGTYVEKVAEEEFNDNTWAIDDDRYFAFYNSYTYAMNMTVREVNQAIEGLIHNLNTLQSRSGQQLPFTSINYGTCTSAEGRMVIKSILENTMKGVGKLYKTPIFPCGIFQYMKGVNNKKGTPNYDLFRLALQCTAKRLYPNYANVDWSGNAGYDINDPKTYFSTMGCRTANGWDINGLGQLKDGRGNICPVTILMPVIAMDAVKDVDEQNRGCMVPQSIEWYQDRVVEAFMKKLDNKIHEAKDMLLERFEWICAQDSSSANFMWDNRTMAGYIPEEGIRSALKHGTIVIGQLGLAETLQILIGCDHTEERGMKLAKKIEQLFKDRCAEFKKEYSLNFGVYYTPAENLCYTAMTNFKKKYGEIPNVSDKDYFTNSMHVPVWKQIDPFEKIDIESQLTGYSSAGCITYVELESACKDNIDALEELVTYAMEKDIPYFAVNVPADQCLNEQCGYSGEFNDKCPVCGSTDIEQLRRVTGYLTGDYKKSFNLGKQQEVLHRVKHTEIID